MHTHSLIVYLSAILSFFLCYVCSDCRNVTLCLFDLLKKLSLSLVCPLLNYIFLFRHLYWSLQMHVSTMLEEGLLLHHRYSRNTCVGNSSWYIHLQMTQFLVTLDWHRSIFVFDTLSSESTGESRALTKPWQGSLGVLKDRAAGLGEAVSHSTPPDFSPQAWCPRMLLGDSKAPGKMDSMRNFASGKVWE